MLKKIPIDQLQTGMYVVNSGLSFFDNPYLYSQEGEIKSDLVVKKIKDKGFIEAIIDTEKGAYAKKNRGEGFEKSFTRSMDKIQTRTAAEILEPKKAPPPPKVPMNEEIKRAETVYSDAIGFAKSYMADARLGKKVKVEEAGDLVENIINSVSRNNGAMVSLSRLRDYDEYTYTHSINVTVLSLIYARSLSLSAKQLRELGIAALFHDVGKAQIPDSILNKPGKLTEKEFMTIKKHPLESYVMLKDTKNVPEEVLSGVVEHHEKYNGMGYPRGLRGDQISAFARIIGVADVYDALTSDRVYKKGMIPNKALSLMFSMREQDFFPVMVEQFIKCLGIYPVGSLVKLSSGEFGVVQETNPHQPLYPKVKVCYDFMMRKKAPEVVDLADKANFQDGKPRIKILESQDHKERGVDITQLLGSMA